MLVAAWAGVADGRIVYISQAEHEESIWVEDDVDVLPFSNLKDFRSLTIGEVCHFFLFEDSSIFLLAEDDDEYVHNDGDLPLTSPRIEDEDELICSRCGLPLVATFAMSDSVHNVVCAGITAAMPLPMLPLIEGSRYVAPNAFAALNMTVVLLALDARRSLSGSLDFNRYERILVPPWLFTHISEILLAVEHIRGQARRARSSATEAVALFRNAWSLQVMESWYVFDMVFLIRLVLIQLVTQRLGYHLDIFLLLRPSILFCRLRLRHLLPPMLVLLPPLRHTSTRIPLNNIPLSRPQLGMVLLLGWLSRITNHGTAHLTSSRTRMMTKKTFHTIWKGIPLVEGNRPRRPLLRRLRCPQWCRISLPLPPPAMQLTMKMIVMYKCVPLVKLLGR